MRRVYEFLALSLLATFSSVAFALPALALGEIFRIDTKGTEYCGDFDSQKFSSDNAVPLWVRIDSDTQLTISRTPGFTPGTTFFMYGHFYFTKSSSATFIANADFDDDDVYATIQGSAKFDKNSGAVTSMSGTFIQDSIITEGCFSAGTFKTTSP